MKRELKHFDRFSNSHQVTYVLKSGVRDFKAFILEDGRFGVNQSPEPSNPLLTPEQWQELQHIFSDWNELKAQRDEEERFHAYLNRALEAAGRTVTA